VTATRAVLAAVARVVLGAVLLLAVVAAMLWAQFGPQGWPLVVFLLAVCAVVVAAGLCASALQPENERGGQPMSDGSETGRAGPGLVCPGCESRAVDLRRGLLCETCAAAELAGGGTNG
jgi:hypothetical protein